ncbi:MAG: hypothetical protein ABSC05_35920 [Candidatus Solibacter sp.]|jgi:hypothetical protein
MSQTEEPTAQWFDHDYWGPGGVDVAGRWGKSGACGRGVPYATTGAPVPSGQAGGVRKISTGRKHRGSSSDDLARSEAKP